MMSLPRYRQHADSVSSLASRRPAAWPDVRLKSIVGLVTVRADNSRWKVALENIESWTGRYLDVETDLEGEGIEFAAGDVLFGKLRPYLAKVFTTPRRGAAVGDFLVLRPRSGLQPAFLRYLLASPPTIERLSATAEGAKMPRTSWEDLSALIVPIPSVNEQEGIAGFLDRETAKLDALIAQQERLIALLQEKRQAVITHAVTKGLDPNVSMKDSGVEWIGAVPAHWDVSRNGRYLSVLSGFAFPAAEYSTDESDTKLLRGINVGVSSIRWDDTAYWRRSESDGLDRFELREGDVVLGMDRPVIGSGVRVSTVAATDLPCLLLQRVALLRPESSLNARFLQHVLSTSMFAAHFLPDTTGVSVPHISPEQIRAFVMPIPPTEEQKRLVTWIEDQISVMAAASREAETALVLLRERRSALITAAVTGQIDVRDLVETAA